MHFYNVKFIYHYFIIMIDKILLFFKKYKFIFLFLVILIFIIFLLPKISFLTSIKKIPLNQNSFKEYHPKESQINKHKIINKILNADNNKKEIDSIYSLNSFDSLKSDKTLISLSGADSNLYNIKFKKWNDDQ